jgi:hypothetical protein
MDHERQLLEQQLWELLYDLLPEGEAQSLRGRIASEPDVDALYERVVRQQRIVADAVKWSCDEISLALPEAPVAAISANGKPARLLADPSLSRRRRGRSFLVRVLSSIAAIGTAVLLAWIGYSQISKDSILSPQVFAEAAHRLIHEQRRVVVSGPKRLVEGAPQSFTVAVTTPAGDPVRSDLHYAFYANESGAAVAEGRRATEADGRAMLQPPAKWDSSLGRLEVRSDNGEPLVAWFDIEPAQYAARVAVDKLAYAPGETLRFRSQALSHFGAVPPEGLSARVYLHDQTGAPLPEAVYEAEVENGAAEGSFPLPSTLPDGAYALSLESRDGTLGSQRQEFLVRGAPQVSTLAESDVERQAERVAKLPPQRALAMAAPAPPSAPAVTSVARDKAPAQSGAFYYQRDARVESFGAAGGAQGSAGAGAAIVQDLPQLAKQITEGDHLADAIDPTASALGVAAQNEHVSLSLLEREVDEGSPLKIEITSQDSSIPLVVGASCRGALVAQRDVVSPPADAGEVRQQIELPLPEGATGPVQVALFDYSQSPPALVAGDVIFCRPRRQLRIQAAPVSTQPAGETEVIEVTVSDENGVPVQALLSVAGEVQLMKEPEIELRLAERVRRSAERETEGVIQLDDVHGIEEAKRGLANSSNAISPKAQAAQSIRDFREAPLPAANWKYEAPLKNDDSVEFYPGKATLGRLSKVAASEVIEAPLVADNGPEIQTALAKKLALLRQQRDRASALMARISVISGVILLGLLLTIAFLQKRGPTWLWTGTLAGALIAIGAGLAGRESPQQLPQIALVAFPAGSEPPSAAPVLAGAAAPVQDTLASLLPLQTPPAPSEQPFGMMADWGWAEGESKNDQLDVWLPRLATGEDGKATISIPRPAEATTVRLSLEGHGNERSGQVEVEVQLLPRQ